MSQTITSTDKIDLEPLKELYAQKPNRRFLYIGPYLLVAVYYNGEKHYKKEKYIKKKEEVEKKFDAKIEKTTKAKRVNNLQFRKQQKVDRLNSMIENGNMRMQWGEPIAVYDSTLVNTTIDRFSNYLFSEGYFHNKVTTKITSIGKYVSINYRIDPGRSHIIDTLIYNIPDLAVLNIVKAHESERLIKPGDHYSEDKLTKERERLDLMLKDFGFYDFSRQYIEWRVDSTLSDHKGVGLMLLIHNPAKRGQHKQFFIDSIRFTTDVGAGSPGFKRTTRTYRDVQYSYYHNYYSLKILSQRLFLSPGDLYSRTNSFNSQRQLANLDAFKFVNINYDTSGGKFIANIFASPLDRYEWSNEIGMNVTQGFPGPFYNINFKKRNIFRGLENFELNGRIGFEGVASATDDNNYQSTEASANASLVFPQFIWPLKTATQMRLGKYNPKTRLSVGVNYSKRPEYTRTAVTLSNTYTWQNKRITQYSLAPVNISLIDSEQTDEFQDLLDTLEAQGNYNLVRSFNPSFVSSIIFGITWNRDYGTYDRNAVYVRAQIESGGTFLNSSVVTKYDLEYFKYLRFNLDYRRLRILNRWVTLAYRLNSGVAYSYGDSKGSLPYEKFFFAGGSNSVRAWRPRRLGLGSVPPPQSTNEEDYDPIDDGKFDYPYERPGEILLEGSLELRSKLVGFINGAVFLDAGNVWAFNSPDDEEGGNSEFRFDSFYRELGVGTGFGLRFDFTFLILRLDVGMKVYDPARDKGERFVLDDVRFWKPYATKVNTDPNTEAYTNFKEPVIYNVGIGFPF